MTYLKIIASWVLWSVFFFNTVAQTNYPQNYFSSPLDIPLAVSGNFAELRSNHFHSGIDFRTNGRTGYPVYAAAQGYVSRIKVSAYGGGKTLYITHQNGYKTVYMHLDAFVGNIADYVKKYQYEQQTFEFDVQFDEKQLPVQKGMLVAKSGNTGSSGGPHLHFEIRQADNDMTINPLLFGLKLCDQTSPTIEGVRIYPANKVSLVENENKSFTYLPVVKQQAKNAKRKQQSDTISVWGDCYFGISTFDRMCNSVGQNGVYRLKLFIDDEPVFSQCINHFMFEDTRYLNALIDYGFYLNTNKRYMLTQLLDYIPIDMYEGVKNRGIFSFNDEKKHKIAYVVSDFSGNASQFVFWVKSVKPEKSSQIKTDTAIIKTQMFQYATANTFKRFDFFLELDPQTLYESIPFDYQVFKSSGKYNSTCYRILTEDTPAHKSFRLGILAEKVPENMKEKTFIVRVNANNKMFYEKSHWENGFLVATPRSFGIFSFAADTIKPQIKPLNFQNNILLKNISQLKIKITDDFSGVATYNCYLNDNWILAEYDGKTSTLTIFDISLNKGENTLKVVVTDNVGNERTENYNIKY